MVQEAAAPLHSPIQGRQGSPSSMWPVLALGILTAIFAWIWYRGSGERREPDSPVQKEDSAVTAETEQSNSSPQDASLASSEQPEPVGTPLPPGETTLLAADRGPCEAEASRHGAPCPQSQDKALSPEVFQAQDESEEKDLSDVDPLGSDLVVQSHIMAKASPPVSVEEIRAAGVAGSLQLQGDTSHQDIKENPTDPKEDPEEHLTGVREELPAQQASVLGHLTGVNEGKELLPDGVQPNAESCPGNGVSHAGVILGDEDQEFALQANGEVVLPTVMAAGAQEAPSDPCNASVSDLGRAQDEDPMPKGEVNGNEGANGADEEAENGTGGQLENSFFGKENARNVLESEETLMQDSYLEINMSSDIECTIVTNRCTKESVEKCDLETVFKCNDIVKPPSTLQENADILDSSLTKNTDEAFCDFQKLGTCPEGSSKEIYSMFNQEKGMSGLGSSSTNEKNTLYVPSEANINEADNQKTKKVATIQPMPQNVNFGFKVHYITHSDSQFIAITGDHEKLGKWETYVPLTSGTGGFWSHSITLPADTNVAWKFIMVENGKIKRWEECNNRLLKITHEDIDGQLFWGYP